MAAADEGAALNAQGQKAPELETTLQRPVEKVTNCFSLRSLMWAWFFVISLWGIYMSVVNFP